MFPQREPLSQSGRAGRSSQIVPDPVSASSARWPRVRPGKLREATAAGCAQFLTLTNLLDICHAERPCVLIEGGVLISVGSVSFGFVLPSALNCPEQFHLCLACFAKRR